MDSDRDLETPQELEPGSTNLDGWLWAVLGTLVATVFVFWDLWQGWLPNGDDAYFSTIARGIFERGAPLDLRVQDAPYLTKPPLFFWILGLSLEVGGGSTFAARLPSALCAVLTCLVAARWSHQLFRSRVPTLVAPLMLVSSLTFFTIARRAGTDAMLCLFVTLMLYAVHGAVTGKRTLPLAGLWLGLAIMVKGVAAGPVVVGVILALAATKKLSLLWSRQAALSLVVVTAVAAPWHIFMLATRGQQFIDGYLLQNTVTVLASMPGASTERLWYITGSLEFDSYLLIVGSIGLAVVGASGIRRREPSTWLLLCGYLVPMVTLSLAGTRNLRYMLPSYAILAVAASGVSSLIQRRSALGGHLTIVVALAFALTSLWPRIEDRASDRELDRDEHLLGVAMAERTADGTPWVLVNIYFASPMYYSERPTRMVTTIQAARDIMQAVPHLDHSSVLTFVPPTRSEIFVDTMTVTSRSAQSTSRRCDRSWDRRESSFATIPMSSSSFSMLQRTSSDRAAEKEHHHDRIAAS